MPIYNITSKSTGKTYRINAKTPKTQDELMMTIRSHAQTQIEAPEKLKAEITGGMQVIPQYNLFTTQTPVPKTSIQSAVQAAKGGLTSSLGAFVPGGEIAVKRPALAATVAAGAMPGQLVPTMGGVLMEEGIRAIMPNLLPEIMPKEKRELITNIASLGAGALTGGALSGIGYIGKKGMQKIASAKTIINQTPEAIQSFTDKIDDLKNLKDVKIGGLKERADKLSGLIKDKVSAVTAEGKQNIANKAGLAAEDFQRQLTRVFREASENYGKKLDTITEKVGKKAQSVFQDDVSAAIRNTIKQSSDEFLLTPKNEQILQGIADKYSREIVRDESGRIIKSPKTFVVNDVINDIKSLRKIMSSSLRGGMQSTADDIPLEYAVDNLIGVINKATKGSYSELQKSYAPIMKSKKALSRIFKPYGGEFQAKQGAGFLSRITKPGAPLPERKLYESVIGPKAGGGFFIPAKDVTQGIVEARKSLKSSLDILSKRTGIVKRGEKNISENITQKIMDEIAENKIDIQSLQQLLRNNMNFMKWAKRIGIGAGVTALGIPAVRKAVRDIISAVNL